MQPRSVRNLQILTAIALALALMPLMNSVAAPAADGPRAEGAWAEAVQAELAESGALGPQGLVFVQNVGQSPAEVLYSASTADGVVHVLADGLLALPASDVEGEPVRITFPDVHAVAGELDRAPQHFLRTGHRDVPSFAQVRFAGEGIDIVVYGTPDGHIEFDHHVAPLQDPAAARFHVAGAELVDGKLAVGGLEIAAPYSYQNFAGVHVPVESQYVSLGDGHFGYALGAYDPTSTLVIDPTFKYASYHGTSNSDYIRDVDVMMHPTDVDKTWVYLGGYTTGTTFPTWSPLNITHGTTGWYSAFIMKLEYNLDTRVMTPLWTAHVTSDDDDYVYAVDLDSAGRVAAAGYTRGDNLPIVDPIRIASNGVFPDYDGSTRETVSSSWSTDAIVFILDKDGNLDMSSYLGGYNAETAYGVALDDAGILAIGGSTSSTSATAEFEVFPTKNAEQEVVPGRTTGTTGFVTTLDLTRPLDDRVLFSTIIGGSGSDQVNDVAIGPTGVAAVGETSTTATSTWRFPTTTGANETVRGTGSGDRAFATSYALDGSYVFSTYLGGMSTDIGQAWGVDFGPTGNIWVGGVTEAFDFPVTSASWCTDCRTAQWPTRNGTGTFREDAFVLELTADGSGLLYSTYYGGENYEYLYDLTVRNGGVWISGRTSSTALPVSLDAPYKSRVSGYDMYLASFDIVSGAQQMSTYFGGTGTDYGYGVAVDGVGNAYLAGYGSSTITTKKALQPVRLGTDGMLAILGKAPPSPIIHLDSPVTGPADAPPTTSYGVDTFEAVTITGSVLPGDDGYDVTQNEWSYFDANGTEVDTFGTLAPSIGSVLRPDNIVERVCLKAWDNATTGYDRWEEVCTDLKWKNQAPVADATVSLRLPVGVSTTFVDASTDVDGTVVDWAWDMGDGATYTVQNPNHSYSTVGTYTVELVVTDDDGATGLHTFDVDVIEGPVAFFTNPASVDLGQPFPFVDGSLAGDDPIASWSWDFGDGTVRTWTPPGPPSTYEHTYTGPGPWTVTLTVSDGNFTSSYSDAVSLNIVPPTSSPDVYSTTEQTTLTIGAGSGLLANDNHPNAMAMHVDSATMPTGGPLTWNADGSFSYTPSAGFTGTDSFTYVLSDGFNWLAPETVTIHVSPFVPPTALFGFAISGDTVVFDDLSYAGDHAIVSWSWDFHDGTSSTEKEPFHKFPPGTHKVSLRIRDAFGLESMYTDSFFIAAAVGQPEAGTDVPPVDAGSDRTVRAGDTIVLDGSASASTNYQVAYEWTQVSGPTVTLRGADTAFPTFVAPYVAAADGTAKLAFQLRVFNGVEWSEADEVIVDVQHVNQPPSVRFPEGPLDVRAGSTVDLAALVSDVDGDELSYAWSADRGSFADATATVGAYTAPDAGLDSVTLAVHDGVRTTTAIRQIRVLDDPTTPVAAFKATSGGLGLVGFDDLSTGGIGELRYSWDFGDGSPPSHQQSPAHQYAREGTYTVRLVIQDEAGELARMDRTLVVALDAPTAEPAAPEPGEPAAEEQPVEAPVEDAPGPAIVVALVAALFLLRRRRP